jgi:uncharacterized Zn finger protein
MSKSTNWIAEDLYEFIIKTFDAPKREEVEALLIEKKVHEVYIEPGRVSSRIVGENKRSKRVVITLKEFSPEVWELIIKDIAKDPLLCAQCYNQSLPFSLKKILVEHGVSFFGSTAEYHCMVDDIEIPFVSIDTVAVLEKLAEQLIANPFGICTIRGKNVEQIIHEIREGRSQQILANDFIVRAEDSSIVHEDTPEMYYEGGVSDLPEINVRADELPASILKRLDPVPLENVEIDVDMQLESAYGRIARLSQSLARFLPQIS